MQLFYQPEIANGITHLSDDESRHAIKVMRLDTGSKIDLTDGLGNFYSAKISEPNQRCCEFDILEQFSVAPHPIYRHIAIAPTKNIDRIEWFVEKAVEFGIDRITPILCDHSERRMVKSERLIRKSISAMKQSIKAYLPQIDQLTSFKDFVTTQANHKFIAYVDPENNTELKNSIHNSGHHLVLIGPEGDFSKLEIELAIDNGFSKVSLGKSRLRTETAGIATVHLLNL